MPDSLRWSCGEGALHLSREARTREALRLLASGDVFSWSGDTMLVVVEDDDGERQVVDCRVRRYADVGTREEAATTADRTPAHDILADYYGTNGCDIDAAALALAREVARLRSLVTSGNNLLSESRKRAAQGGRRAIARDEYDRAVTALRAAGCDLPYIAANELRSLWRLTVEG